MSSRFEIRDQFYLDDKPFKVISGGIHYFRVVPEYWMDRLEKLKALGCNTVETYVPWNMHEPKEGKFCFDGMLDLVKFIACAQSIGLYVIVRPSPYICGEWEFGGLPAWLLTKENMVLRTSEGDFLSYVRRYYDHLLPLITPLQIDNGGPVIMLQIENEYGYFGDDAAYLAAQRDMMRELGITVPFITSDGPQADYLNCGSIEGALPTGNFGSNTKERFDILAKHIGNRPLMCTEFWVGWFDHWGCGEHHTTDPAVSAFELGEILDRGHVNIYMFHGGTNFGFMNGSNNYGDLAPDVTSYDYDALLREDGRITPKYEAFREVIARFLPEGHVAHPLPAQIKCYAYGSLTPGGTLSLWDALPHLGACKHSTHPQSMEMLGESYGYVLYRSVLPHDTAISKLRLYKANDRAQVFLNEQHVVTLYDRELLSEHEVDFACEAGTKLDILTENMGRVNYGVLMREQQKGIAGDVLLNGRFHSNWDQYALPMTPEMLHALPFSADEPEEGPTFSRFTFEVDEAHDTFLDLRDWGKGCVSVNGFMLGRFWDIGPQKRLYIPAPLLREGKNECIIFESEGRRGKAPVLYSEPDLG